MRHEGSGMAVNWYDLGVELLDSDTNRLDMIEKDFHNNEERCSRMFKRWLEVTPDASWSRLVTALENVGLIAIADSVRCSKMSEEGCM